MFPFQYHPRGGEGPTEGEEQDGDEAAGHHVLGLRWCGGSPAQSKRLALHGPGCVHVRMCVIVRSLFVCLCLSLVSLTS